MTPTLCLLTGAMSAVAATVHATAGFHEVWDETAFSDLLAMPGAAGYLALDGDEPIGLVLWRAATDEAEILTICTVPERRQGGVARSLLDAAAKRISEAGATRLLLEVAIDNQAAIALYRTAGFVEAGRRKAYYRHAGVSVDALILVRAF